MLFYCCKAKDPTSFSSSLVGYTCPSPQGQARTYDRRKMKQRHGKHIRTYYGENYVRKQMNTPKLKFMNLTRGCYIPKPFPFPSYQTCWYKSKPGALTPSSWSHIPSILIQQALELAYCLSKHAYLSGMYPSISQQTELPSGYLTQPMENHHF